MFPPIAAAVGIAAGDAEAALARVFGEGVRPLRIERRCLTRRRVALGGLMAGRVDYEWRLRPLLAERGVYSAAELAPLLAEHGVRLCDSQVWWLYTGKPERLNLHTLMVLCEILQCTPNELIVGRAARQGAAVKRSAPPAGSPGLPTLRPSRRASVARAARGQLRCPPA